MSKRTRPADIYLRFLQLSEALRDLPSPPPLEPLEERILSFIAFARQNKERLSVKDLMGKRELGSPAMLHGRLKSMRAKGWILLAETEDARRKSRSDLGISDDEIVFLFLGRLSFHAKAHPFPMYTALEAVARESGKRLVILQCGWFANEYIEKAFKDGARNFCPSIRHLWLDGRQEKDRKAAWAAGGSSRSTLKLSPACGLSMPKSLRMAFIKPFCR